MNNRTQELFWQGYRMAVRDYQNGDHKFTVTGQCNPTDLGVGYRQAIADLSNGINRLTRRTA